MSQDDCHSSLITSSHNNVQSRKERKEARTSLFVRLFLIREKMLSQNPPADFPFGQPGAAQPPLGPSQVRENAMDMTLLNQNRAQLIP